MSQTTTDRLVDILRRDLRLGPQIELTPETVLFGGELDLDSLDALLLVQSIEKGFGIKVPTEAMGPEIFATMQTLSEFVQSQTESRQNV
jgi:acyl carrier protein